MVEILVITLVYRKRVKQCVGGMIRLPLCIQKLSRSFPKAELLQEGILFWTQIPENEGWRDCDGDGLSAFLNQDGLITLSGQHPGL